MNSADTVQRFLGKTTTWTLELCAGKSKSASQILPGNNVLECLQIPSVENKVVE